VRRWWSLIALAIISTLAYTLDLVRVSGISMSPSLCDTDIVVARRIWFKEDLQGKIVVAAEQDGALMVKRVLALGGDEFRILRGSSIRNEAPVAEPYVCDVENNILVSWPEMDSQGEPQAVLIPEGSVFLLGDNRTASGDSRSKGPVQLADVQGVVMARFPKMLQQNSCGCVNPQRLALHEPR
jgi:signal peptidase I